MLYIIATPIGNRQDITHRALDTLKAVDFVVAEDTRHTGELLAHFEIKKDLISFRDAPTPVMDRLIAEVVTRLKNDESAAYVTDAGTPGVSDPGWRLVDAALEAGIVVTSIPGPSAVTALLSVADIQIDEYRFVGFLPKKKGFQTTVADLLDYLQAGKNRAVIFYESPHRVQNTLAVIARSLVTRQSVIPTEVEGSGLYSVIGRELTKKFETIYRGQLTDAFIAQLPDRGEYVILITV